MSKEISITIPIPPAFCDINRVSRNPRANAAHRKKARQEARDAAYLAVGALDDWRSYGFPWAEVELHVTWYHPTHMLKDRDNILTTLKASLDGLTEAGIWEDDKDVHLTDPVREVDRANPRVVLKVRKWDE